jgi:branched-chain amino acid transport system permease protein
VILIGGVGTVSGAVIGAAVFRLLQFYLDRWFGGSSELLIGLVYVALVLYVPYGIVGTWRTRSFRLEEGRARLISLLTGGKKLEPPEGTRSGEG